MVLESLNIIILYFFPQSSKGNGVGVFNAYEKSKEYPEIHSFIKYLINWIAGSKLIFIVLLGVIVVQGNEETQFLAICALVISIATFFWRLYPLIKSMDKQDQISPKGYSKTLGLMIGSFLIVFGFVVVYYIVVK